MSGCHQCLNYAAPGMDYCYRCLEERRMKQVFKKWYVPLLLLLTCTPAAADHEIEMRYSGGDRHIELIRYFSTIESCWEARESILHVMRKYSDTGSVTCTPHDDAKTTL